MKDVIDRLPGIASPISVRVHIPQKETYPVHNVGELQNISTSEEAYDYIKRICAPRFATIPTGVTLYHDLERIKDTYNSMHRELIGIKYGGTTFSKHVFDALERLEVEQRATRAVERISEHVMQLHTNSFVKSSPAKVFDSDGTRVLQLSTRSISYEIQPIPDESEEGSFIFSITDETGVRRIYSRAIGSSPEYQKRFLDAIDVLENYEQEKTNLPDIVKADMLSHLGVLYRRARHDFVMTPAPSLTNKCIIQLNIPDKDERERMGSYTLEQVSETRVRVAFSSLQDPQLSFCHVVEGVLDTSSIPYELLYEATNDWKKERDIKARQQKEKEMKVNAMQIQFEFASKKLEMIRELIAPYVDRDTTIHVQTCDDKNIAITCVSQYIPQYFTLNIVITAPNSTVRMEYKNDGDRSIVLETRNSAPGLVVDGKYRATIPNEAFTYILNCCDRVESVLPIHNTKTPQYDVARQHFEGIFADDTPRTIEYRAVEDGSNQALPLNWILKYDPHPEYQEVLVFQRPTREWINSNKSRLKPEHAADICDESPESIQKSYHIIVRKYPNGHTHVVWGNNTRYRDAVFGSPRYPSTPSGRRCAEAILILSTVNHIIARGTIRPESEE